PFAGRRHDDDVRPAVAVDVAEGSGRGADVPGGHDDVLLADAKVRVRPLRRNQAPTAGAGHLDAGVQRIRRTADSAVAGQHHVGLQGLQLPQAAEHVAGAEVDAARVAQHAARHDQVAEGEVRFAALLKTPGHRAVGVPGNAHRPNPEAGQVEVGVV